VTTSTPVIRAVRGVVAGLRDDVAELHLRIARARQCAMTALAVTLATTIAPASMQRGALRIIGAVIGLLLTSWLIEDQVALSLVLLVVSTLSVL
jgi:hypothetical protein